LLVPPPKRLVLEYLGIPIAGEKLEKKEVKIIRKAETDVCWIFFPNFSGF